MGITTLVIIGMVEVFIIALAVLNTITNIHDSKMSVEIFKTLFGGREDVDLDVMEEILRKLTK